MTRATVARLALVFGPWLVVAGCGAATPAQGPAPAGPSIGTAWWPRLPQALAGSWVTNADATQSVLYELRVAPDESGSTFEQMSTYTDAHGSRETTVLLFHRTSDGS